MDDVVIFGAGGLGELVQDILREAGQWRPVAFIDSDPQKHGRSISGLPVWGGSEQIQRLVERGPQHIIVAIGDNPTRVALAETLAARGLQLASAIHPLAAVSPCAVLEPHVVIGPRATVCVHARIGSHSVLSAGVIAEHDNVIGRGVFLDPAVRLAGGVSVEDLATIGIGAAIIPGRRVGRGARVEPGAVVIQDVAPGTTVGGIPASTFGAVESQFVPDPLPIP